MPNHTIKVPIIIPKDLSASILESKKPLLVFFDICNVIGSESAMLICVPIDHIKRNISIVVYVGANKARPTNPKLVNNADRVNKFFSPIKCISAIMKNNKKPGSSRGNSIIPRFVALILYMSFKKLPKVALYVVPIKLIKIVPTTK
jgi:hypothetical protein